MARAPTPVEMTDPLKGLEGFGGQRSTPGPRNYGGTQVFTMIEQLEREAEWATDRLEQAMPALNHARNAAARAAPGPAKQRAEAEVKNLMVRPAAPRAPELVCCDSVVKDTPRERGKEREDELESWRVGERERGSSSS